MIQRINLRNIRNHFWISEHLTNHSCLDFYFTVCNKRIFPLDSKSLRDMSKDTEVSYYSENDMGDCDGIIAVLKSVGGGKKRYYLKINANTSKIAENLITVVLWNFHKDIFFKVRKDSKFLYVARKKGFKFYNNRGYQILLKRKFITVEKKVKNDYK